MKKLTQKETQDLFRNYVNNKCSKEELELVFELFQSPANLLLLNQVLEEEKQSLTNNTEIAFVDPQVFERVSARLQNSIASDAGRPSAFIFKNLMKVAAAITLLICFSFLLYTFLKPPDAQTEFRTAFGETRTLKLDDGSEVILNSNSRLVAFASVEKDVPREVWISGEAYFKVKKSTGEKRNLFIVHTDDINIEVLGTEFNVNNRRGKVAVVLNSGKVKLEKSTPSPEEVLMKPGDLVEYDRSEPGFSQKLVDPSIYSSWKDNLLVFDDAPFSSLVRILEDNFGFEVIVQDPSLLARRITAKYPADNPRILIKAIAHLYKAEVEEKGSKLIISLKEE